LSKVLHGFFGVVTHFTITIIEKGLKMSENMRFELRKQFPSEWFPEKFFGFEVGDGWLKILVEMFEEIAKIPLSENDKPFGFLQIKEKFGDLRVYAIGGNDKTTEIIKNAEVKASETCDICGAKGLKRNDGWISVRCEEHTRINML
jgi:hypothetical protein